jgi:hypothetical protein
MIEIQTNVDEIGEYLQERELYGVAIMLKRRADEESAEGPGPTTFLGLQMAEPGLGRFGVKPMVTGATEMPVALPASGPWAGGDPVGDEGPLGFSIDELPALGGASASEPLPGAEVSPSFDGAGRREDRAGGGER